MSKRVEMWTPEALRHGFDSVARSLGLTPEELEADLGRVVLLVKGSAMGVRRCWRRATSRTKGAKMSDPNFADINWPDDPVRPSRVAWASSSDWLVASVLDSAVIAAVVAFRVRYTAPDGRLTLEAEGADGRIDDTVSFARATVAMHGTVNWDGCANLTLGDGGYRHFCGPEAADEMRDLYAMAYATARATLGDDWDGGAGEVDAAVVVKLWQAPTE